MRIRSIQVYLYFGLFIFLFSCSSTDNQTDIKFPETLFEKSEGKSTSTYWETIDFYNRIAELSNKIQIKKWGETDAGEPLHVVSYDSDGIFDIPRVREKGKVVFLINSGIHPGESCGIDASMLLLRKILEKDTTIEIGWYKIGDYKTYRRTFEGHYVHYQTKLEKHDVII